MKPKVDVARGPHHSRLHGEPSRMNERNDHRALRESDGDLPAYPALERGPSVAGAQRMAPDVTSRPSRSASRHPEGRHGSPTVSDIAERTWCSTETPFYPRALQTSRQRTFLPSA